MKTIKTRPITVVENISKEEFQTKFYKTKRPVLVKNLTQNWKAYKKWNLDYIQKKAGNQVVPLYDNKETKGKQRSAEPATTMRLYDYLELLKNKPTNLRIFFYNILKNMPSLANDFEYPKLGLRFFKKLPTMFFGGKGSRVLVHYDMDLPELFHIHFHGTKKVILFPPNQTKYLYRLPFTVHNIEAIDMDNPDFEKYPALQYAEGIEVEMQHGDMLYMPSGYWHYIKYLDGGFSISLRAFAKSPKTLLMMFYNVFVMRHIENIMRKLFGQKWLDYKENKVMKKAEKTDKKIKRIATKLY